MIDKENLEIVRNKNILVSVSGGVDSMVLLHFLIKYQELFNYNLEVFHFNHLTRNGQSNKDAEFVKEFSKKNNIRFHLAEDSMSEYAKKNNISEEESGRILRKESINKILSLKSQKWIVATAHNLDDQVETVLMRIIRGTGINGLSGMKYYDGNIFRPFLRIKKSEIIRYAKDNNVNFVQDSTNFENIYTRNSIRNELIPLIKSKYNNNFYQSIINLSDLSVEQSKFVSKKISELRKSVILYEDSIKSIYLKENIRKLEEYEINEILRNEIARFNNSNYDFEKKHYIEVIKIIKSKNSVEFNFNNIVFYNSFNKFIIRKKINNDLSNNINLTLNCREYFINGYKIKLNLDCSDINLNDIIIRTRKNGDRILLDKKIVKLKDFFINKKIDKFDRDYIPIIELGNKILFVGDIYKLNEDNNFITIEKEN